MSVDPPAANGTTMRAGRDRIGLRPRDQGCGRQGGSAGGQMQKSTPGKFHHAPSRAQASGTRKETSQDH